MANLQGNSDQRDSGERDRGWWWNLVALALAAASATALVAIPMGSSMSVDSSGVSVSQRTSLLETEGASVLLTLAVPLVIVGAGLFIGSRRGARRVRIAVATALGLLVVLGAMSIGVFFLPTFLAMLRSATSSTRPTRPTASTPSTPSTRPSSGG